MASKEEDAELLRGGRVEHYTALCAVDAEKRNVQLESTLQSLTQTNQSLQSELEKERAEKQKLAALKADAERSKTEAVEKFEDLCQSERRLREREQSNLQTLAQQRESLNDTQQKLNNERQTNMQKSFEIEKLSNLVRSLTNKEQSLNHELEDSNSRIKSLNNQINHLQELYDYSREDNNTERTKLLEKINNLQSEKKQLQDKADQLGKELEHARIRVIEVENSLGELTRSKDQMELNLGSTQKAFKDLQALYDAHTSNTRTKFSSYETKIDLVTKEKEELAKQNKELEDQLAQERELRKVNFNQMTGVTTEAASGGSRPASNLLRLIQDYQSQNRRPEDIFEDFFDLQKKYDTAVKSNTNLNSLIEELSRKQREKGLEFDRLYRELKSTGNKNMTLETSLKDQKKAYQQLTDANTKLQSDYSALQRENADLTASLNDTTYQLQHILSVIQKRSEPIPAGLKESARLLHDANIKPNLSHQDLVYDNVAQLQDLNKELSVQVRSLREKLKQAQDKIGSSTITHTSDANLYKQALLEAKQATSDLSDKVKQLQSKLDTTTTECENYKKIVNELGDGDAKAKFEQMQDTQERQRQEMDITLQSYRKETLEEMNKLKEELINSRASEKRVQSQLTSIEVEKRNLLIKLEKSSSHSQRLEGQSNSLVRDNAMLHERLLQSDQALSSIKKEMADYKSRLQVLREENMILQTRYEAMQSSYKEFREMRDKESSEKDQMASLLEALKTRFDHITSVDKGSVEQSLETVEKLTRELQHARDTLASTEKQLDYYKSIDQSEIQDKYKEAVVEIRVLKTQITEMEQKLSDSNQERIIAQTKLATAEEQLKKALSSAENASSTAALSSSCDEHVRLLAEAEDRVRILEDDNNAYQTIIAEKEKLISASTAEHDTLVTKTQASIDKLLKDIEERNEAVRAAQEEAEKAIAEYNALKEQSVTSQAELADEKAKLDEKIKQLEASTTSMQEEISSLKQALEVKTNALADVEVKLESESKLAEEQRQASSDLRADVSNLTFEIAQYKATIAAAAATEAKLRSDLEHETNERNTAEESWKNKLAELNKQQEQLSQSVSELVAKYAEWAAANDKQDGPERAGFVATTEDIVKQLREANTTLRIEKDASELNYQTERNKRRRAESEMEAIKTQVATLRADIARLREENKSLLEKSSSGALDDKMQYEAFKSQNQLLMMENSQLRETKQKALMEQAKMEAQISPLELKVSSLEAELTQAKSEVEILEKSQKEWTARSAKLLSKYNRIDPAEIESVKAELETTKKELETTRSELETLKTEKSSVESTVEELQAKIKSNESDRASLVQKANERGRMAFELRKKLQATTQKLEEATKSTDASNDTASKAEVTKLTQEKEALETQVKDLTTKSTREREALETQIKDLNAKLQDNSKQSGDVKEKEAELAQKTEQFTALEKKYAALLMKARKVQIEQKATRTELDALKASKAGSSDSSAKVAALEAELADLRKQSNDHSVEATRYKAQLSMAQGKANRLQREIELLKSQKPSSTLSANAPAFQLGSNASPVSSPRITAPSSPSVIGSPALATSPAAVSSPVAPPAKLLTTTETAVPANVPEVVASPIVPAVESPAPSSPAPPPPTVAAAKSPVLATNPEPVVEEPMPSTPEIAPANNATDTKPITTTTTTEPPTQETEEAVDAELSMEVDSAPNVESEQMAQTTSAASEELVEEGEVDKAATQEDQVPVNVQVQIEKPSSPVIEETETADVEATFEHDDTEAVESSSVTLNEETVSTPIAATEDTADDANAAAEVENDLNDTTEPALPGGKRQREEDEEDLSGIESPTKAQKNEE
ncbi:hypothetical protein MAM1_0036d02680 [Mucor ambiguus]|uniref:NUA/TPR/MLP1-2-like domain-containing protein n=1 Tax=Mucor ambiguus TaxID=91626 RepID=A0A0C9MMT8_9FUNG|nr:hypothetical protein MAM1_0036d02680 [Mucor ambiguus]